MVSTRHESEKAEIFPTKFGSQWEKPTAISQL